MEYNKKITINNKEISIDSPTYFIADIAANHDGDLSRAKDLIWLSKESGADAAKFQHFKAEKIVSDYGFKKLETKLSHQSFWKKTVFETYKQYECNREWTEELIKTAKKAEIDLFTSPYDIEAVELLDKYIPAYKIGSGDITWIEFIEYVSKKNKPILLATGASSMQDVERAVNATLKHNKQIALMQCNTNYTASIENFKYINLKVIQTFTKKYPGMVLGLSDHTQDYSTVLGAITLGARIIEKHFTDDNHRKGPDHAFAMNPISWEKMVHHSREIEAALGSGIKEIEKNEQETIVVQRRCIRTKNNLAKGAVLKKEDLECLRPAPEKSIPPYEIENIIGKTLLIEKEAGDAFYFEDLEEK
jgi:sialic acid synthase SpsE